MGERMCGSENLQLQLLGASVWTSLRWILPMHLGLLSEILLRRISATRIAEQAGSISNELLSRMGSRLPIVIKE